MDIKMPGITSNRIIRKQVLDALFIIVLAVIVYFVASKNDILERMVKYTVAHENWELDEFISVSIFLVFALLVYTIRRFLELRDVNNRLLQKNNDLEKALSEIKHLRGILPICSACKKIRDDKGYWHQVESYVREHSDAQFSHSICPDCMRKLYPEYIED